MKDRSSPRGLTEFQQMDMHELLFEMFLEHAVDQLVRTTHVANGKLEILNGDLVFTWSLDRKVNAAKTNAVET